MHTQIIGSNSHREHLIIHETLFSLFIARLNLKRSKEIVIFYAVTAFTLSIFSVQRTRSDARCKRMKQKMKIVK